MTAPVERARRQPDPYHVVILVAASLAPTEPVLAADVQVVGVYEERVDDLRFALT